MLKWVHVFFEENRQHDKTIYVKISSFWLRKPYIYLESTPQEYSHDIRHNAESVLHHEFDWHIFWEKRLKWLYLRIQKPKTLEKKDFFDLWNTIRTRHLWWIKVDFDFLHQFGSYMNIVQFRLVLKGKAGKGVPQTWTLELLECFSQQFCFIRCRRQHSRTITYRKNSKITFYRFTRSITYARSHVSQISGKQYVPLFYLHKHLRKLLEPFRNNY